MGFSVVVLENDPRVAQSLAGKLSSHFNTVHFTPPAMNCGSALHSNHPEVMVLDIEYSRLGDVNLHHDFPLLPIVCLYRVPDEELWVDALEAGASDVCGAGRAARGFSVLQSMADGEKRLSIGL